MGPVDHGSGSDIGETGLVGCRPVVEMNGGYKRGEVQRRGVRGEYGGGRVSKHAVNAGSQAAEEK